MQQSPGARAVRYSYCMLSHVCKIEFFCFSIFYSAYYSTAAEITNYILYNVISRLPDRAQ